MTANKLSRILIVDDNPTNLHFLVGILKSEGYTVRPARDGLIALNSALSDPPDLILLDILMPKMDGYETCRKLKADIRTKHIPVIFISSLSDSFDRIKAYGAGCADYIGKPFNTEELLARVSTSLSLVNSQQELIEKNAHLQREISNRKRAERDIKESEKRFATVMNSMKSIVYVADMKTYELLFINEYTRNLFGDVVGQVCWKTIQNGQTGPCPFCNNSDLTAHGKPTGILTSNLQNTKIKRWFHIQDQAVIWTNGHLVRMEIATDISDLKQAEKDLVQAKKAAEAANKAKSAFLANMSHELRSPLNAVLGYADILLREASEHQKRGLNIIKQSGNHLLDLINDVLDLAKVESGTIECSDTDFHLYYFLNEITAMVRLRAERKGLLFKFEADENELSVGVRTDEQRLRQVLLNLLSNAVNYTETGGITLKVEKVEKLTHFTILDTGIGISPKHLGKIFDPFYQASAGNDHSEAAGKGKGTGLGLAISRTLIELLGGKLDVKSKPGRGTTFHLALHLPETSLKFESAGTQKQKIIGIRGEPPLVLVVDDQPENRSLLTEMLTLSGFKTADAENGLDGFEKAMELQPAAIVTDLIMPKSDGFELIRRVRGASLLKNTPIIAVSASAYKEDQEKGLDAGADAFLPKPFDHKQLIAHLKNFLKFEWLPRDIPADARQDALPAELILPSDEILKALSDVAQTGDVIGLREKLAGLGRSDQTMLPFVSELRQMLDEFRLDGICRRLREYLQ